MTLPESVRRPASPCGCGPQARGACPHATACPRCHAAPGTRCKRPSGHPAGEMHAERYRASERADADRCPGFEAIETPAGTGCRHCSGLPEDHTAQPIQWKLTEPERSRPADSSAEQSGEVQGTLF